MNRAQALAEFATFGKNKDQAIGIIVSSLTGDQSPAYILTLEAVLNVLTRCLAGEIDLDDLELWANVLESRTDIDHSAVEGVIYALSNSEQMGEIDNSKIERLVGLLIN
ncbi:hypothetical protein H5154_11155 [Pseudoalteromonas sp. SR44-5]|uniref:hypothetical protein n=1 Tax=Pseudoalteromonas TaxID=53246 RepID=UPI0016005F8D|nr:MULTISPECIES: hypothetical protein [unclassified Pseudoalteromonas]MBB1331815.1 hypothetical protein [Pseudoalteromonas sp. SR41-6]MBB1366936.1 hypothetical protein [Pseudoalteromonas sp. SR44-5]MBB1459289.1 hypothetical protein [Pseudoalteromonas sp. SG41-8]MBB1467666.1 hypothetical protein [Pseudoalteromonas sp. SG41-5]